MLLSSYLKTYIGCQQQPLQKQNKEGKKRKKKPPLLFSAGFELYQPENLHSISARKAFSSALDWAKDRWHQCPASCVMLNKSFVLLGPDRTYI